MKSLQVAYYDLDMESNDVSRSSSVSMGDKSGQIKRGKTKHRRLDSGSFDVRSQYTQYYPQTQQATWGGGSQYGAMGMSSFSSPEPNAFQSQLSPQFGLNNQPFNLQFMSNGAVPGYGLQQVFVPKVLNIKRWTNLC